GLRDGAYQATWAPLGSAAYVRAAEAQRAQVRPLGVVVENDQGVPGCARACDGALCATVVLDAPAPTLARHEPGHKGPIRLAVLRGDLVHRPGVGHVDLEARLRVGRQHGADDVGAGRVLKDARVAPLL